MSPYEINLLLHFYCRYDAPKKPPIFAETVIRFLNMDLITPANDGQREYKTTEKGTAFVKELQALTPNPSHNVKENIMDDFLTAIEQLRKEIAEICTAGMNVADAFNRTATRLSIKNQGEAILASSHRLERLYNHSTRKSPETAIDDKSHPRFQAGYKAGLLDKKLNEEEDDGGVGDTSFALKESAVDGLKWTDAPTNVVFTEGMKAAVIGLNNDESLFLYVHKTGLADAHMVVKAASKAALVDPLLKAIHESAIETRVRIPRDYRQHDIHAALKLLENIIIKAQTLAAPISDKAPSGHYDGVCVDDFATHMKLKLDAKRQQGFANWHDKGKCTQRALSQMLHTCVAKGDPIDVANLCMMLQQRGESIMLKKLEPEGQGKYSNVWCAAPKVEDMPEEIFGKDEELPPLPDDEQRPTPLLTMHQEEVITYLSENMYRAGWHDATNKEAFNPKNNRAYGKLRNFIAAKDERITAFVKTLGLIRKYFETEETGHAIHKEKVAAEKRSARAWENFRQVRNDVKAALEKTK